IVKDFQINDASVVVAGSQEQVINVCGQTISKRHVGSVTDPGSQYGNAVIIPVALNILGGCGHLRDAVHRLNQEWPSRTVLARRNIWQSWRRDRYLGRDLWKAPVAFKPSFFNPLFRLQRLIHFTRTL